MVGWECEGGGSCCGKGLHGTGTRGGEREGKKHLVCHGKPSGINRVSPWFWRWALKAGNVTDEGGISVLKESLIYAAWKLSCPPSIQKAASEISSIFIF